MIEFIVGFIFGVSAGVYGYIKLFNKDRGMNTDDCLDYLRNKGYYVKLNVLADKEVK